MHPKINGHIYCHHENKSSSSDNQQSYFSTDTEKDKSCYVSARHGRDVDSKCNIREKE